LLVSREPNGKDGFKAFRARQIGGNPDLLEYSEEFGLLVLGFWARFISRFFASYDFKGSETANRILAIEVAVDAKLIEDFSFFCF